MAIAFCKRAELGYANTNWLVYLTVCRNNLRLVVDNFAGIPLEQETPLLVGVWLQIVRINKCKYIEKSYFIMSIQCLVGRSDFQIKQAFVMVQNSFLTNLGWIPRLLEQICPDYKISLCVICPRNPTFLIFPTFLVGTSYFWVRSTFHHLVIVDPL